MGSDLAIQVEAQEIFDVLLMGKHYDRELAQEALAGLDSSVRAALRGRIVEVLPELPGDEHLWTRSWLLSSLGRVADDDDVALGEMRERVLDHEGEDEWVRYWTLEGAVAGSTSNIADLGRIAKDDPAELPMHLGLAIVANEDSDAAAKGMLMTALGSDPDSDTEHDQHLNHQWLALRALRVMPVEGTEKAIVAILDKGEYGSENYQAVVALGAIPPDSTAAVETAALALQRLVVARRNDLMWSEARARALKGLGRLRFRGSAPTLVDELLDGNPATVREAAIALEAVLGTDRAVDRVVEAASAAEEDRVAG
jgi:hypothetical protein